MTELGEFSQCQMHKRPSDVFALAETAISRFRFYHEWGARSRIADKFIAYIIGARFSRTIELFIDV